MPQVLHFYIVGYFHSHNKMLSLQVMWYAVPSLGKLDDRTVSFRTNLGYIDFSRSPTIQCHLNEPTYKVNA